MAGLQPALDRHHYVEPASFAVERDRVLARTWTCVDRLSRLRQTPGRLAVVEVLGESVLVTSDAGAALAAYANVCRHRGSQLVPHVLGGERPAPRATAALRCPYHSWTYGLDGGRLLRAPHTDDVDGFAAAADSGAYGLHRLGAAAWGGFLWVGLDPARPLLDELGAVPERVRRYPLDTLLPGASATYDVAANWKVLAENYNECYHCGPVHPELVRLVPGFGGGGGCADGFDFWDVVNRQDWAVCESVQRGMSSRFFGQGWYAPMEDASLDIRRWLLPRLGQGSP